MTVLSREVAVVGVGYSELTRSREEPNARQLTLDAGLRNDEVDGMVQYFHGMESPKVTWVQRALGIKSLDLYMDLLRSGPSGLGPALVAATAVAAGVCEVALAYRTLPQNEGNNARVTAAPSEIEGPEQFTAIYGNGAAILSQYALKKRRRVAELGGSYEDYGLISVTARKWSALNDRAVLRDPVTMDEYMSSRVIVDPLVLYDCDYPINGSCAVVITTAERARDLRQKPVYVDSVSWGTGGGADFYFCDDYLYGGSFQCTKKLYEGSSIKPQDIDVLGLYDGFTHLPISWIEALGICGRGEFGDWVDGGKTIEPGGAVPLNTSGGMLAEGRLQGLGHVTETVLQLRGAYTGERQVPDAEVAAVAGGGSTACGAMLLRV